MKRGILAAAAALVLLTVPVSAAETFDNELYEEQMEESGASDLMDSLPSETQELLRELGIEGIGWEEIASVEPEGFFGQLGNIVTQGIAQPAAAAAAIMGVMVLCTLATGMGISIGNRQTESVLAIVGTLCACTVIAPPIVDCISQATALIQGAGAFLLAGVPVIAGLLAACGQPISASGWTVFLLAAGNGVSFLSAAVLMPVMNIFLGFSLVSAVSPEIRLTSLCTVFAKTVRWLLTLTVTIFTTLLSAQSMITASADGAAVKATKMLAGFVPVVGGVLGDAMGTVQGCVKLLKSGAGAFGLLAALCLFLPVLIRCLLWILCCTLCAAGGDLLGLKEISGVLRASSQVLQTLVAVVVSCGVIMIVAGVLLMQGGGSS